MRDFVSDHRAFGMVVGATIALALFGAGAWAAPLPSVPIREEGVCPFECCIYREWTADEAIPVYARERDTTVIGFVIERGEPFDALTGNQYVTKLGLVVVTDTIPDGWPNGPPLIPGDSLWLLSNCSEGVCLAWSAGSRFPVLDEWWYQKLDGRESEGNVCRLVELATTEWWVKVRAKSGREGWIRMDGVQVDGSDECS